MTVGHGTSTLQNKKSLSGSLLGHVELCPRTVKVLSKRWHVAQEEGLSNAWDINFSCLKHALGEWRHCWHSSGFEYYVDWFIKFRTNRRIAVNISLLSEYVDVCLSIEVKSLGLEFKESESPSQPNQQNDLQQMISWPSGLTELPLPHSCLDIFSMLIQIKLKIFSSLVLWHGVTDEYIEEIFLLSTVVIIFKQKLLNIP